MAFAGDVRAWLTSLLSCINSIVHNGKNLVCSKIDGTTVTVSRPVHRYTIPANANKTWWRIAQSNVGQLTPMHCEFILRAKNAGSKDNYQIWHCFVEVYGNASGVHILGGPNLPFSQLRILYENTVANVTDEKLSYIDLYCNQKNSSATEFEIEEIYNDGITFVADGAPSASSIPSGYENRAVGANQSGIYYSSQSDTSNYSRIQYTAITADATLAANWSYRMRVLNCTQPVTLTVNQTGAGSDCYHWVKNSSSGVVTIHPATSSIYFDDVSADITLQPGEFIKFHCQSTGHYVILEDGRWKSKKLDAGSSNYVKSLTISGKTITVTKGDDTTATLTTQDTTYSEATQNSAGLMSAQDKTNLDTMAAGSIYVHPTYTARTGKPTADATPGFGDTVTVSQITSDTTGHVTAATDRTITIPATEATSSAAGLMSAADKTVLDGIPNTYVSKAGDTTMSGILRFSRLDCIKRDRSTSGLQIQGGDNFGTGANLVLYGKDNDTNPGKFSLYTTDATGEHPYVLVGNPNGTLKWGSNNLLTDADAASTYLSITDAGTTYLPLSGGTLTGNLTLSASAPIIATDTNTKYLRLANLDYNGGASLYMYGAGHTSYPGQFSLNAYDGTTRGTLRGKPDGTLTWGDKNVACVDDVDTTTSGYMRLTNGLQMVWGVVNIASANVSTGQAVTFEKAFSSAPRVFMNTAYASAYGWGFGPQALSITTTGFTAYCGSSKSGTTQAYASGNVVYFAIGPWA